MTGTDDARGGLDGNTDVVICHFQPPFCVPFRRVDRTDVLDLKDRTIASRAGANAVMFLVMAALDAVIQNVGNVRWRHEWHMTALLMLAIACACIAWLGRRIGATLVINLPSRIVTVRITPWLWGGHEESAPQAFELCVRPIAVYPGGALGKNVPPRWHGWGLIIETESNEFVIAALPTREDAVLHGRHLLKGEPTEIASPEMHVYTLPYAPRGTVGRAAK